VPKVLIRRGGALIAAQSPKNKETLEHDPENWRPVFRKEHAQTKC
jgi:hypothetical protein